MMFIRLPSGDVKWAVGYMVESSGEKSEAEHASQMLSSVNHNSG